jgi:hypothetical protein
MRRHLSTQTVFQMSQSYKRRRIETADQHAERTRQRVELELRAAEVNHQEAIARKAEAASRGAIVQRNLQSARQNYQHKEEVLIDKLVEKDQRVERWKSAKAKEHASRISAKEEARRIRRAQWDEAQLRLAEQSNSKRASLVERLQKAQLQGEQTQAMKQTFSTSLTNFRPEVKSHQQQLMARSTEKKTTILEKHQRLDQNRKAIEWLKELSVQAGNKALFEIVSQ